jgi:hypothetical protein
MRESLPLGRFDREQSDSPGGPRSCKFVSLSHSDCHTEGEPIRSYSAWYEDL